MQGPVGDGLMASGLGIGLSLVKTIAQLHGGTVEVVSPGVGLGSQFIVTLPVLSRSPVLVDSAPGAARHRAVTVPAHLKGKHILLIDDNPDINQTLSDFLVEAGHDVECAKDGPSGLRMEGLHHHDVICCDIAMPGMDGYEVAKTLHRGASNACLIAISGYDQPEHRDRALQAGFDHYLVKPIDGQELLELIDLPENMPA